MENFERKSRDLPAIALAAALAACSPGENKETTVTPMEPTESRLLLGDYGPQPPPLVLPISNGVRARISQIAGGDWSHYSASTRNAVDIVDPANGPVLAPISGTIRRKSSNCSENTGICDNRCNGGWGNTVELRGVDDNTYLFAHCDAFRSEAPEGSFVLRGTPLCDIGCTGRATGEHVHADRIANDPVGVNYTSRGIPEWFATESGEVEPSRQTPSTLEPCCGGCTVRPTSPDCKTYISFNRPLTATLQTFAEELRGRDSRILGLTGPITPLGDRSNNQWLLARQDASVNVRGSAESSHIEFAAGSPAGSGMRNPFLDTAFSRLFNPASGSYEGWQNHVQVHTERFIKYDLWDYMRNVFQEEHDTLEFPESVTDFPDWSPVWELHGALMEIDGETVPTFLAVHRSYRGFRVAIHYVDGAWSEWTIM